jgi:3-methylfumaryl-CoA hydratase
MHEQTPRTQTLTDTLDPARARAMQATLGVPPTIIAGAELPPFFHHLYFWDPQVPAMLGRDGHSRRSEAAQDPVLPRRMWAAGRLVLHRPLLVGTVAEKTSTIESVIRKQGRSGPLSFVRLRHDIRQRRALVLSEWQELVYRADPGSDEPQPVPPTARTDEDHAANMTFNSTLLFRYSALTFNGHRIHYDRDYARQVEGYGGLVVHGPLLAQLLMLLAEDRLARPLRTFVYRATAPLMDHERATLCWKDGTLWVRGPDGRQCMIAEAT